MRGMALRKGSLVSLTEIPDRVNQPNYSLPSFDDENTVLIEVWVSSINGDAERTRERRNRDGRQRFPD
jgi:hypothetical protein